MMTLRVYKRSSFEIFPAFWYREWIVFMRAMALIVRSSLGGWVANLHLFNSKFRRSGVSATYSAMRRLVSVYL